MTPCSFNRLKQRQNLLDLRMGQAGHRFVGDQELRLRRHGAREFELAHFDLGKFARQSLRLVVEADLAQEIDASRLDVRGRAMSAAARRHGVEKRNAQIVGDAETGKRPRQLKGTGKPAACALVRSRAVEHVAVEMHRACFVPQRAADAVHQRALAGAVGSNQPDHARPRATDKEMLSRATNPPKRLPRLLTLEQFAHGAASGTSASIRAAADRTDRPDAVGIYSPAR